MAQRRAGSKAVLWFTATPVAVLLWAGGAAHAQTGPGGPSTAVDEVIVTAQKRRESAQDVPISIQALSARQVEKMGISNTNDLPLAIPGFQISSSASNQLYYLRGVGSQQVGPGTSPEVATFVDGVYMPSASAVLAGLSDIESIEVDKGPQGTLFGRNSTGGVIQINTKEPSQTFGGEVRASFGSYDHAVGALYVTGGLTDRVAASLSLLADKQAEGYGVNQVTGKDVFKRSIYSARGKVRIDISDLTQLSLRANFDYVKGDAGSAISPARGVALWNQVTNTQQVIPFYDTAQDTKASHTNAYASASAKLTHDLGWADFMSLTAYQGFRDSTHVDFDGGPEPFLPVHVLTDGRTLTQELQLSSPASSAVTWTVGGFFLREVGHAKPFHFGAPFATFALPFGIPLGDSYELYSRTSTTSLAAYAQATVTILPDTRLTVGARYTHDKKTIRGRGQISGPVPPAPLVIGPTVGDQEESYGEPTFRVALDRDFAPNVKGYVSYNRGFQSGGFNAFNPTGFSAAANPALAPETIDAYEVGLKSELFERRVRFNVAGFLYDYSNLQQQIYVSGTLQTLNAGAARIKGVDVELVYEPTANLTLGFVGEVLDAKFRDYVNAPGYTYPQGYGVGPLVPTAIPNARGNHLLYAPKYTGTAYVNHTVQTSLGEFATTANVAYNDGYYADPGNLYKHPSYFVVNVNGEWSPNEELSLQLWVRNLFDQKYSQSVTAVGMLGFVGNTPGAPREIGVTARYRF